MSTNRRRTYEKLGRDSNFDFKSDFRFDYDVVCDRARAPQGPRDFKSDFSVRFDLGDFSDFDFDFDYNVICNRARAP